jgi:hypothetical protein
MIRAPSRKESPRKLWQFVDIIEFNGINAKSDKISERDDSASNMPLHRKHHDIVLTLIDE